MPDARTREAAELMTGFAERTGLTSKRPAQRYLWTDAFAVCNLLGLARATGDENYTALALALIEAVHRTLGRHRPDHPGAAVHSEDSSRIPLDWQPLSNGPGEAPRGSSKA